MCEHNWILHDSKPEIYFNYPLRKRILFKRGTYRIDDRFTASDIQKYGTYYTWYCTKCREFSTTYEETKKIKPIPGRAIWWKKHSVWLVPKEVFHLTQAAMDLNPTGNLQKWDTNE